MNIEVIAKWPLSAVSLNQNYALRDRLEAASGEDADGGFGGGYYTLSWFAESPDHAHLIESKVRRAAPSFVKIEILGLGPRGIRMRVAKENPLTMGGTTERNVLIGVATVGLAALAYEMFKAPAPNAVGTMTSTGAGTSTSAGSGSSTPSGPSSSSAQPYLITVPMSSATDPAMPVPSGATIQVVEPSGGTGGFTAGLVSSPTTAGTDASGNILLNYTVIAASGTSGSYAWTSADGSVVYSIPINVT